MTPYEQAMSKWKADPANARRKGTATHYANGKPKVEGKTQKQAKTEALEKFKNRHNDPNYKHLGPGYTVEKSSAPPKKDKYGWAGKVGEAHMRNQKAEHEKGYREDYK